MGYEQNQFYEFTLQLPGRLCQDIQKVYGGEDVSVVVVALGLLYQNIYGRLGCEAQLELMKNLDFRQRKAEMN